MSRATHTPGPWRIGKSYGAVVADHPVPGVRGSDDVKAYGGHMVGESIARQNLALIAAAPELLDAHEPDREGPGFLDWVADRLVIQHGEHEGSDFILCLRRRAALARAAIAKATTTP